MVREHYITMTVIEEQDSANAALDSRGLPVTAVQLGISITLSVKVSDHSARLTT